jgi:hypothetical protein
VLLLQTEKMRQEDQAVASGNVATAQQARDSAASELLASQDEVRRLAADISALQGRLAMEGDARREAENHALQQEDHGVEVRPPVTNP